MSIVGLLEWNESGQTATTFLLLSLLIISTVYSMRATGAERHTDCVTPQAV